MARPCGGCRFDLVQEAAEEVVRARGEARRDGSFARVPGGPLLDHAFHRVIPNHVIARCNAWDFQARVHAGMVLGCAHKPAGLIVEREHGRGRLVAATFRLLKDAPDADPVATALLDGLIELAMGGNGEPDQDPEGV